MFTVALLRRYDGNGEVGFLRDITLRVRKQYGVSYGTQVKRYYDIAGDGGSRILEQVAEQRARITDGLAAVRHLVAVGSGKGGVGKSTLTFHLAGALRARGLRIAILDAVFKGTSQERMAGVQEARFIRRKPQV